MHSEPAWIEAMSHLPSDRLSELGDSLPTAEERAHLDACALCAREWGAYRSLASLAASSREGDSARHGVTALPLTRWEALAPVLRAEGLIAPRAVSRGWRASTGVAAALLLFVTGAAVGRTLANGRPTPVAVGEGGMPLSANPVSDTLLRFGTREEALAVLDRSSRDFQQASAYLGEREAQLEEVDSSSVYRTRLAALDDVMKATRAAMYEAPHDPVINRYYLATLGAREATLRQLNTALPVGTQLSRY